jgi:NAD(P)-dependent dehydrogenase (short-subunit alcohol dehydrogenase family)
MRPFLLLVKALELRRLRVDRGQGQAAKVPIDRAAAAEEIAAAVLFLASDQSSYMTDAEMFVDGGLLQV